MNDLEKREASKVRRRRLARIAAIAGALAGAACHFAPHDYQAACSAIAKAASLSMGGC